MAESEKPASEEPGSQHSKGPQTTAGEMIAAARKRAGLTPEKVASDLRISTSALAALEAGQHDKLSGAPYTRALLVSLSRYLRLDTREVLAVYAEESGQAAAAAAPISPYKDDSKTHARAHKQIFILIVVGLLLVLLLIVGKVSSTAPRAEPPAPATSSDTLLNIDAAAGDSLNDTLGLDSLSLDSAARADTTAVPADGVKPAKVDSGRGNASLPAAGDNTVRLLALSDSAYVRVIIPGRRERSHTLAPGQSLEVTHDKAVTFITRNSGTLEVKTADSTVVPNKRRFRVDGTSISY